MNSSQKKEEATRMKRVWDVYNHSLYKDLSRQLSELEKTRAFCHHDYEHAKTVARLAYMFVLEREYDIPKDIVYTAAILHDIGRVLEYTQGLDHAIASELIARQILAELDFTEKEIQWIAGAIDNHRTSDTNKKVLSELGEVLRDADKASRDCYLCEAVSECNWNDEKKNLMILW